MFAVIVCDVFLCWSSLSRLSCSCFHVLIKVSPFADVLLSPSFIPLTLPFHAYRHKHALSHNDKHAFLLSYFFCISSFHYFWLYHFRGSDSTSTGCFSLKCDLRLGLNNLYLHLCHHTRSPTGSMCLFFFLYVFCCPYFLSLNWNFIIWQLTGLTIVVRTLTAFTLSSLLTFTLN